MGLQICWVALNLRLSTGKSGSGRRVAEVFKTRLGLWKPKKLSEKSQKRIKERLEENSYGQTTKVVM